MRAMDAMRKTPVTIDAAESIRAAALPADADLWAAPPVLHPKPQVPATIVRK